MIQNVVVHLLAVRRTCSWCSDRERPSLRLMATSIRTPLSNAYRRRAAELELQAAALAAGLGFQERPICVATVAA